ncbi:MAG: DNA/RNA non-specific endonuclease [Muribaculaceae bacterium]|nr:DNA/RNA non-specific endonuclease [Muribaculaceae bacterium]
MLAEHKWQLQLIIWALTVALIALLMARQCGRRSAEPCSPPLADSLQLLTLDSCQRVAYRGFTAYFDPTARVPRCVVYELTAIETRGEVPRSRQFERDGAVEGCPEPDAYAGSGMDRGHMAPAADMKWDSQAMDESFRMTNICPQNKSLNEGGWNRLEEKAREWARRDSALIIAAGPVIEPGLKRTAGGVVIPQRFYKVILAHHAQPMRAIAFVYPNTVSNGPLRQYAVSVDSVERLTGIDFFAALPDEVESRVERAANLASFLQLKQ